MPWFLTKNKSGNPSPGSGREIKGEGPLRDRRKLGTLIDRVHRELTDVDINRITSTYHAWRSKSPLPVSEEGQGKGNSYSDIPGFCKSATLQEIAAHGYVLTSIADGHRWLRIILVGEQIGSSFERGVLQSPTSGDQVHLVTNDDRGIVYGGYNTQSSILIRNQSASEGLAAQMDMDKLISRHCAVLGALLVAERLAVYMYRAGPA